MNDQQRAAMREAISTLVEARARIVYCGGSGWKLEAQRCINAIACLNEALAQSTNSCQNSTKLVETQPQGEWVDLTEADIWECCERDYHIEDFARAVIAKFKEKNKNLIKENEMNQKCEFCNQENPSDRHQCLPVSTQNNQDIKKDYPQIGWAYINMVGVVDVVRNEEEIPPNAFPIFADADLVQASRNVISEITK